VIVDWGAIAVLLLGTGLVLAVFWLTLGKRKMGVLPVTQAISLVLGLLLLGAGWPEALGIGGLFLMFQTKSE
jgi:hypothetical protein